MSRSRDVLTGTTSSPSEFPVLTGVPGYRVTDEVVASYRDDGADAGGRKHHL
ncbi:MAG: hypothetical protein QM673_02395 [Gordonia sp. (in: high G+C Gram-positive bacteria)]